MLELSPKKLLNAYSLLVKNAYIQMFIFLYPVLIINLITPKIPKILPLFDIFL